MKRFIYLFIASFALGFTGCDKVYNPYPEKTGSGEIDWSLYPNGDSVHYAQNYWPSFTANTNINRNVLIEDFTGHKCVFCPAAAAYAEQLEEDNPGRVFVSTVHTSPNGLGDFQEVDAMQPHDFTCAEGLSIGTYFGEDWAGSPFQGNPFGTISRVDHGNGYPVTPILDWTNSTNLMIAANDLKVNIQSDANYFSSTRGLFVHAEVDVLDQTLYDNHENLYIVVQLHEDSIVQPQKIVGNATDYNYVHRDVLRATIDGRAFGRQLDDAHEQSAKFYYDYSYTLPDQYDASNMHLLIYVRDETTEEVYQVIKQKLQ